jgi:bifunctional DNase/RNase
MFWEFQREKYRSKRCISFKENLSMMSEMYVTGITLDPSNSQPVVVLNDHEKRRALPIWVGHSEAASISTAMQHAFSDRPFSHDLMMQMIDLMGYKISRVDIHTSVETTFLASITLVPFGRQPRALSADGLNQKLIEELESIDGLEQAGPIEELSENQSIEEVSMDSVEERSFERLDFTTEGDVRVFDSRPSDAIALALRADCPIYVSPEVFAEGTISLDLELDEMERNEFRDFVDNIKASDFKTIGENDPS